jgi:hypothetical protein
MLMSLSVVDVTAPNDSVTLAPGGSENITINMRVSGAQAGIATFEVYREWELQNNGTFAGSNPQEFTVGARSGGAAAETFSTTGTVSVASGVADGLYTLEVGVFDITNSNATGAKLAAGRTATYDVTVEEPAASDTTAPSITITKPADGDTYTLGQNVLADYSCEDEAGGSGLKSCFGTVDKGAAIDTGSVGQKSFTVDAEDNDGNKGSKTVTYNVVYNFSGFFRPVDNLPTLNSVKAGSAVPVKFSLNGNQGLNIFASGSPASKVAACDAAAPVDAVEETLTAGNSSLQYDSSLDQYTYVWKTEKTWAGSCRQLVVKFNDGTTQAANFKLLK